MSELDEIKDYYKNGNIKRHYFRDKMFRCIGVERSYFENGTLYSECLRNEEGNPRRYYVFYESGKRKMTSYYDDDGNMVWCQSFEEDGTTIGPTFLKDRGFVGLREYIKDNEDSISTKDLLSFT